MLSDVLSEGAFFSVRHRVVQICIRLRYAYSARIAKQNGKLYRSACFDAVACFNKACILDTSKLVDIRFVGFDVAKLEKTHI